jgi:hypothetical protein
VTGGNLRPSRQSGSQWSPTRRAAVIPPHRAWRAAEARLRPVGTHPARRLWAALEPLHDVVYFADGVRPAGIALGLRGFWMTYFARCAR